MNDNQKQELIELFHKTPYMPYREVVSLFTACLPERSKLISRMLLVDIRQFTLKVYFWEMYNDYGDVVPLPEPSCPTKYAEIRYYVFQEAEMAYFWQFGELSTQELKKWLQYKSIASTFFEIKPANIPDFMNSDLTMHSYKLAAAVKAWEHFYIHGLTHPKKSPKQNILAWLRENAESLNLDSEQSMEEIAKIVNWKPDGGAPKS